MLAGSPAALRAYARFRSELRHGALPWATQQRIALAVAEHQESEYALSTLQRTAREAGLGLDEIALAREFDSRDEREATLLRYVRALLESEGPPPLHVHEEAREAGWSDEQILEAVAHVALASFANLVTRAGDVPDRRLRRGVPAAPGGVSFLAGTTIEGTWSPARQPRPGHGRLAADRPPALLLPLPPRGGAGRASAGPARSCSS